MQPPGGVNPTITDYDNNTGTTVTVSRGGSLLTTTLDGFGRPIATVNSVGVRAQTEYDAEGRVTKEGYPFDQTNIWTAIAYDELGRVRSRTHPDGTVATRTYGPGTVTIRDENGRETVQTWQAFGHPDDAQLVAVVDATGQSWAYAYNAVGSLTGATAPDGIVRSWVYNSNNLLSSETHPESGTTTYVYAGNLLTRKTDANLTAISYAYDNNDRLKTISGGGKTTTINYEPDSDQRQSISASNGSTTFVYDAAGRPDQRKDVIGAYVFFSHYQHDANDNLVEITYPSLRTVRYEFDTERRVTRVFEPQANRDYAVGMTYHPSGALATYTAGNGIPTVLTYDPARYWVRSISSGPLQLGYNNYDGVGNVQEIADNRPGLGQTFTYDLLDRLKTVTGPLSPSYAYDVHGNRTSFNGSTYTYQPGTLRLSNKDGVAYTYDNSGNMKTAGGDVFTYTPENWLASAAVAGGTVTYTYDDDGWRTRKTAPGENTFSVRGLTNEVLTEWHYTPTSTRARDYIYAGGRLVSGVDRIVTLPSGCGGEARPDGSPNPITISTPGGSANVSFEGSGCRRASVMVTVTSGSLGCNWYIELRRSDTNALVGGPTNTCSSVGLLEPVTLPVGGEYSVTVRAASTGSGSATVQIYDVVDAATPITSDGLPVPVDLLTPGQNARLPFTGTQGQRMSVLANVVSGAFGCVWYAEIHRKDTDALVGSQQGECGNSVFLEPVTLPADGDYVVVVNPRSTATGSAAIHLYDVVDVPTVITANGTVVPVDLTVPGRNTRLQFTGTNGQRMSVWVTVTGGNLGCVWYTEIHRKDTDALVGSRQGECGNTAFLEPVTLPADGDYVVVVNPAKGATGTAIVRLYAVVDPIVPVTLDGAPVSISITTPGQNGRLTFVGTSGQRVSASGSVTNGPLGCVWYLRVLRPDDTVLEDVGSCNNSNFQEPVVLPSDGVYTILVDPSTYNTGSASVSAYDVPPDPTGTLAVNGAAVPVSLTAPGQNAYLTFPGTQGQSVTVRLTGNTIANGFTYVSLVRPNGTVQTTKGSFASSFNLSPQTLSTTGTYTVRVDPSVTAKGNISVQVTSP
jgi:YD repeat-containing protein